MKHVWPVPAYCVETQSFAEHEATARRLGLCSRPGAGCAGYYYGGIDLAPLWSRAYEDIPVWASVSGIVTVQNQGVIGYGLHVRIAAEDDELVICAHLDRATVSNGQYVNQGGQVGWMGNTGNSTGKHLHWEIREKGIPVDPMGRLASASQQPVITPTEPGTFVIPEMATLPLVTPSSLVTQWLNVRTEPAQTGRDIGNVYPGDKVKLLDALNDVQGNVWYLVLAKDRPVLAGWVAARWNGETWLEAVKG